MKTRFNTSAIGGALVLLALSAPLSAQTQGAQPMAQPGVDNINWNERELRNGLSANRLVGMDVRGKRGNSLGEVQHLIVGAQGKVTAIAVESGGFMNIGDTHFRIPWNQVEFGRDMDHVVVPLDERTAEQYRDRKEAERVATGAREYRLSRIKDGSVTMRDGTTYGEIEDLIVSRNGDIKAVIVDSSFGPGGLRAVPFQAATFDFDRTAYTAPFDRAGADAYRPFDYRAQNIAEPRGTGATGATGSGTTGGEQRMPQRQSRG